MDCNGSLLGSLMIPRNDPGDRIFLIVRQSCDSLGRGAAIVEWIRLRNGRGDFFQGDLEDAEDVYDKVRG